MIQVTGKVVTGMKKAAGYLNHTTYIQRLQDAAGFFPYPGTLNLEVEKEKLDEIKGRAENNYVQGFEEDGRKYGGINCFRCKIDNLKACIIVPDMSMHSENIMEIIAAENLREKLNLQDGSTVTIEADVTW